MIIAIGLWVAESMGGLKSYVETCHEAGGVTVFEYAHQNEPFCIYQKDRNNVITVKP
jgi:hypothetical protein